MILTGIYQRTIYRNEDNGMTLFSFMTKDAEEFKRNDGTVICRGSIPEYSKGTPIRLSGDFKEDKNSWIFLVNTSDIFAENNTLMENYLSGSAFHGIGPKVAKKIIEFTGPDIFNFIQKENAKEELLNNIKEFNKTLNYEDFVKTINNTAFQTQIYRTIAAVGGTYLHAQKMYEKYGLNALNDLNENPYKTGFYSGMTFYMCDAFAKSINLFYLDYRRISSLILYALDMNESAGNTYITLPQLHILIDFIVKQSAYKETIPFSVIVSCFESLNSIHIHKENNEFLIFKKTTWNKETSLACAINRLSKTSIPLSYDDHLVSLVEKKFNIKYSEKQKEAFNILKNTGVKVLTGGPGTGKSTIINGLVSIYKEICPGKKIALAAPTGRAAQRITEITGMEAFTIHRLLEVTPFNNSYTYKDSSDPIDADLIIIDESSMLDTSLAAMLLDAVKNNSLVVFCGDINQLPAVGSGNVLGDIIAADIVPVYHLTTIYRQAKDSPIIELASNVCNGMLSFPHKQDVSLIHVDNQDDAENIIDSIIKDYYDKNNVFALQLLTTTKGGALGTRALNRRIQEYLAQESDIIIADKTKYGIGDKIMTLNNNYEKGYLNGDVGEVIDISNNDVTVLIGENKICLKGKDLQDLSLAYAMTAHKSQGSQYETVAVILPSDPANMLQRNLLYTALTRAKKKLFIISIKSSFETAVINNKIKPRQTDLKRKLQQLIGC